MYKNLTRKGLTDNQSSVHNSQFTIHNSQLAQATALQTAIEPMRRRKGEAGGVCVWQFNEPWPAISWAIVDYFGRPKLAYERLQMGYNPVLISLKFPVGRRWLPGDTFEAEIWAINDTLEDLPGCELQISLADADSSGGAENREPAIIYTQSLDLAADSARLVGTLTYRLAAPPGQLTLALSYRGEVVARNLYDLDWFDSAPGRWYHRLRRRLADWALR